MILLVSAAHAQTRGNRVYFGQDIFVASGQQIHNAVCLFCSVQVEGDLTGRALVLFGNLNVTGRVDRNATVIGGNAVVDSQARIGGNTIVLGGNAVYETDDSISGSAYVIGGHLSRMGGHVKSSRRLSVSPVVFSSLAFLAILLLSAFFFPRVRRRAVVSQLL
jgi:carbonic anhydrase/acetyltransferase-like protein (isoleucine patch superfamily)